MGFQYHTLETSVRLMTTPNMIMCWTPLFIGVSTSFFFAAIMSEIMSASFNLNLDNLQSKEVLPRTRASWQGDRYAPQLLNTTFDRIVARFASLAKQHGWGWRYKVNARVEHLCLLLFANNHWIVATSPVELQKANDQWQSSRS